jgi:hypothetical protein
MRRAILIRMANAAASLRGKIDLFLKGYSGWSAKRIAKARAEWQGELLELSLKGSAAAGELVAAVARVNSAASETERSEAQLALGQAVIKADGFRRDLEDAIVTIRAPGTFIYDFLTLINRRASFAERSASMARIRARFQKNLKGLLPKTPEAKAALLQRRRKDAGLKTSLFNSFLMAAGRSEEPQTVRVGTDWIKDKTGAVANIVPARHFGPATSEFQSWFQKEARNFFEADLLNREHPPASKDCLNEPREYRISVDGLENDEYGPKGKSAEKDVAAVRYDLAQMNGPEQHAMRRDVLDVVNTLGRSDRQFLVRMDGAKGASGAERTRLSRLRKKIRQLL